MRKSLIPFLVLAILASVLVSPEQVVKAQGVTTPATINKTFTPDTIPAGGTSTLRLFFFNPNTTALTNARLEDNMPAGIQVVSVLGNTCGGTVTAAVGSSDIILNGGTIPAQTGSTPGECIVTLTVTAPASGTFVNRIPAGRLTSTGPGGVNITNISPASATLVVDPVGSPTVTKSFGPNAIWAGGTSQLTIVIANNSNVTLTGVTIFDDLPTNVFLANPASPSLSSGCGGSASVIAPNGGTQVTLNNGTIAPASTCTITVTVTGDVQGIYNNQIPAGRLGNDQNLTNATPANARLTIREIGLSKRFSPPTFSAGGTTTLIITLQNPRSTPYTGVAFTDTLPPPMTAVSVAGNTCGGTVSITPDTAVTLSGGTIPPGNPTTPGTCTISVVVTVPAGTPSGTLTNSIPAITNDQGKGILGPANGNVTIAGSEVRGIKSFNPSSISAGGNSRLTIEIFAPGNTGLTNFSVRDELPPEITISNSTAATLRGCGAATLTATTGTSVILLERGTIAIGGSCRIQVSVTSSVVTPPGTPHTNTIPPSNISNAEGLVPAGALTATLAVNAANNLAIGLNKNFNPPQVFLGAASTMSIRLTNPGNIQLTNISFDDNMPAGMILADPVNFDVGTCGGTLTGSPGDGSFRFSGGILPPNSFCILTLSATMSVDGNLINVIPAGSVSTDQLVTNDSDVEATLSNLPGANVSKEFAPNPIPAGSFSALTITIANTGSIELLDMGLLDELPNGLVIAGSGTPAPVNNCRGTLRADPGTAIIELTGGSLPGLSTCTMVVSITGSTPGDYENTIPVGNLVADPAIINNVPAVARLTITPGTGGGGGGGGGSGGNPGSTGSTTAQSQSFLIPVTGFAPGRVTELNIDSRPVYAATGLTIDIPVLKVNTSIVGVESKNGKWDVSWLQNQAGWLNGTAYPTWSGNSVLTGHVANADGKPGVFAKLKALGVGEYIYIYNGGYRYTYQVLSNEYVQPTDASVVKHEEKSFLTLVTCDTYDEKTGTYLRRVAVRAKLVDVRLVQ